MTIARDRAALLFANETFYRAFAERDVPLMEALWADTEPVTCLHPGWPPVEGREAVLLRIQRRGQPPLYMPVRLR